MNFEDLKIYLPKFLSVESEKELFEGLKDFPDNIDSRIYTDYLSCKDLLYQGDGIKNMLVFHLPSSEIRKAPSMILSNTCAIDLKNKRSFSSQIVYAPIFKLDKYKKSLYNKSRKSEEQIESHIEAIKKQRITQIFFLPKIQGKLEDSIVFFDRILNCPNNMVNRKKLNELRIFTLSDYGAYLFLLKLSIHFTRIQDKVERKSLRI